MPDQDVLNDTDAPHFDEATPSSWWARTWSFVWGGPPPVVTRPRPLPPLMISDWDDTPLPQTSHQTPPRTLSPSPAVKWTAEQLAQAVTLVDSDTPEEALAGLQAVRHILSCLGLDIVDMARRLAEAEVPHDESVHDLEEQVEHLQSTLFDLRNDIRTLRAENIRLQDKLSASDADGA